MAQLITWVTIVSFVSAQLKSYIVRYHVCDENNAGNTAANVNDNYNLKITTSHNETGALLLDPFDIVRNALVETVFNITSVGDDVQSITFDIGTETDGICIDMVEVSVSNNIYSKTKKYWIDDACDPKGPFQPCSIQSYTFQLFKSTTTAPTANTTAVHIEQSTPSPTANPTPSTTVYSDLSTTVYPTSSPITNVTPSPTTAVPTNSTEKHSITTFNPTTVSSTGSDGRVVDTEREDITTSDIIGIKNNDQSKGLTLPLWMIIMLCLMLTLMCILCCIMIIKYKKENNNQQKIDRMISNEIQCITPVQNESDDVNVTNNVQIDNVNDHSIITPTFGEKGYIENMQHIQNTNSGSFIIDGDDDQVITPQIPQNAQEISNDGVGTEGDMDNDGNALPGITTIGGDVVNEITIN